jgi:hypothetical protein
MRPTSAGASHVGSLTSHPFGWIGIPIVVMIVDRADRGFQFVPSTFVIECPADKGRQEGTALPLPKAGVQLADEFIGELYVHSHVPMIAHTN